MSEGIDLPCWPRWRRCTIDRLRRIPDLAALVTGTPAKVAHIRPGRIKNGQKVRPLPNDIAARDMLDDVRTLLAEAVRVVVEEQRYSIGDAIDPAAEPGIAADCGYLILTVDVWQDDPFACQWVDDAARKCHGMLERWTGETPPRPPRLACPACSGGLHRACYAADGEGEQLACEDCGKIIHPADIAHLAVMHTPASLPDIAAMLDRTERTLQRWVDAGLLHAVTDHDPSPKRPALYLPSDAVRIGRVVKAS